MDKHIISALRKIVVISVGVPIVIIGIILIPVPGPGLLVTLLGLFILSLEFEWARRRFEYVKGRLMNVMAPARKRFEDAINDKTKG